MHKVLLIGIAVLLTGCSVGPKYQRPQVQVPTAFKEPPPEAFKEQNGWKPGQPQDDKIRGKWWELFGDSQLDSLEDQVNINNQNIAQAEAQFREARAAIRIARSSLFPTVTTSPSVTRSHQSANSSFGVGSLNGVTTAASGTSGTSTGTTGGTTTGGTSTGTSGSTTSGTSTSTGNVVSGVRGGSYTAFEIPFDLSYEFDAWGRIRHQIEANVESAQASAADIETARLSAHAELATDYFELRGSDQRRQLLERTVNDYQEQLKLTIDRRNEGIATDLDVEQARTQLETTRAQLTDLGVSRAQYEHAIAVLIGKPPAALSLPNGPITVKPPVIPVALPSELLERRPDIASAERRVASLNAQIGVTIAAFYPEISLSAAAGLASSSLGNLFTWPSRIWSVGPALAQTLFDGGYRRGVTQQAEAAYEAQVAVYRQSVLAAFQDVEDNLAAVRVLDQESTQEDLAVQAAERSLDLARFRYRGGVANYLDVITAEGVALTNESTAIDILTRRMTSSVALVKALGGGWNVTAIPGAKDLVSKKALPTTQSTSGAPASNN